MTRRRALGAGAVVAGALVAYLLAWPVPIAPVVWVAPPERTWTPTGGLSDVARVALPEGHGPEDVAVDAAGRLYTGDQEGRIWRFTDGAAEVLATTGGRVLGLDWHPDGRLIVADAFVGLLDLDVDTGAYTVLATSCAGAPLVFTDDVDVGPDGAIWFTDASTRFDQHHWKLDLFESGPNGRLCVLRPGETEPALVLGGLHFANGVALDPAGRFVLVAETARYRVRKIWLDSGRDEVLVASLPGFPDGISTGDGRFWIAVASPRNPVLDAAAGHPWARRMMVRLPAFAQPAPVRSARVIAVDGEGRVLHDLYDPDGVSYTTVTSVEEHRGRLYLGSLVDVAVGSVQAP